MFIKEILDLILSSLGAEIQ